MKKTYGILFFIVSLKTLGQLIVPIHNNTNNDSANDPLSFLNNPSISYTTDTIRKKADTIFIQVKAVQNKQLIHQEEQIVIISVTKNNGAQTTTYNTFWHGHSVQFYPNGQKKCEGTFKMGQKLNDWKYWNNRGIETHPLPSSILSKALQSEKLIAFFNLQNQRNIFVVDTSGYFFEQRFFATKKYFVEVDNNWPAGLKIPFSYPDCSKLILYKVTGNKPYILHFIKPCNNTNLVMQVTPKKNKIKAKILSKGQF